MKIIVNGDDLGASANVNRSILELMDQGRVTSATLLVNGPAAEDAVRQLGAYPHCSFGVHLNLTQFLPLSSHPGLAPLLGADGQFAGYLRSRPRTIPLSASIRQGAYAEWCAQVERALELGVPISHLDSHHHVHTRATLLGVLKRVQQKYGIRKVRLRHNVPAPLQPMRPPRRTLSFAWKLAARHYLEAVTTEQFTSFSILHEQLRSGARIDGSIEAMCHPGHPLYAAETELLHGDWLRRLPAGAQLIGYNDL